jgi:hypothetical protein
MQKKYIAIPDEMYDVARNSFMLKINENPIK